MTDGCSIRLPLCPSVNALYLNRKGGKGRGRIKTPQYRQWLAAADAFYLMQKRSLKKVSGLTEIKIVICKPHPLADPNNYVKALCDYLVSRNLTDDDKHQWKVSIEVNESLPKGECVIFINPLTSNPRRVIDFNIHSNYQHRIIP